jgi:hypothetical protein
MADPKPLNEGHVLDLLEQLPRGTTAFEFIAADGHAFRVWPDGTTEGFPAHGTTINRIPTMIAIAVSTVLTIPEIEGTDLEKA